MRDWRALQRKTPQSACGVCGKVVVGMHKYCSRDCAAEGTRRGLTMGVYSCAFCGRRVERAVNEVRRQKYCSRSCALHDRAETVVMPDLDPAFGHWFAGLADGEGCFTLMADNRHGSVHARFSIDLRADDRPILELIRRTLGFGHLYAAPSSGKRKDGTPNHPKAVFATHSVRANTVLVEVFRRFPLRSKKARDFALWAEAIVLMESGNGVPEVLIPIASRLKAIRQFRISR